MFKNLILFLVITFISVGCDEDPMRRGRAAHAAENADIAEAAFNEVIKLDGKNFEARRLLADIHRFRGEFSKTETALMALWKEKKFDDESQVLSVEDRVAKQHLSDQFDDLYSKWSEKTDAKEKPKLFEEIVLKGLARDPKSPPLNRMLVDFYFESGDRLVDQNEKEQAAETFEKILTIRALPKQRKDAEARATKLRNDLFVVAAKKRFEGETLQKLKTDKLWDPGRRVITVSVDQPVDRKINPKKVETKEGPRQLAMAAVRTAIKEHVVAICAVNAKYVNKKTMPTFKVIDENFKRGLYQMTAEISFEDLLKAGFAVSQFERKQAAKDKKNAKKATKSEKPPKTDEKPADKDDSKGK